MKSPLARVSPPGVLVGSFAGAILLGAVLLRLPMMHAGPPVSFLDCLFTSTSAICVTGLASVDTGRAWSAWGLATIALMIQAGGLGIMTFSMAMIHLAGKKPSLRSHLALKGALGPVPGHEIGRLARDVIIYTLVIEILGIGVLFARFLADHPPLKALGSAVFHGVSAFCNAGFSIYSDNLEGYLHDPTVNLTIMALIVLGGLGFLVLRELGQRLPRQGRARPGGLPRLSLHTKMVAASTLALLLAGVLGLWLLEHLANGGQVWRGSLWPVLFTAVTPRTAGFNTLPMAELSNASLLFIMVLMFVGGSPGSCAGGIKTTTLATLVALTRSRLKGQHQVVQFKRRISDTQVGEALTLVLGAMAALTLAVLLLAALDLGQAGRDRAGILAYAFEAVSAFGTVGLSMGITYDLGAGAKLVLIGLMFLGRLGPLTIVYVLGMRYMPERYKLAEERIMLG